MLLNFFLNENIPITNTVACTDEALWMVVRHKCLLSYLKSAVPNVFKIRCIINNQHIFVENHSYNLSNLLQIVTIPVRNFFSQFTIL